jgi:opacity protein-like surface antigen
MRKMKLKLALGLFTAASALLLSDVASAYHSLPKHRWYARLAAGYTFPDNITLEDPGANGGAAFRYDRVKIKGGFTGDIALGFHFFRMLRGEIMFNYVHRKISDNNVKILSSRDGVGALPNGQTTGIVESKVQSFVGMVNGYIDLLEWHRFIPYVGAGIGFSANKLDNVRAVSGPANLVNTTYLSRTNTDLAWQLTAGTAFHLTEQWTGDLYYRYMDLGKVKSSTQNNQNSIQRSAVAGNNNSHMVMLGVRYSW